MSKNMSEKLKNPEAKLSPADLDFEKLNGLLPVIAQDESSGAVLMLAYANREAVQKTLETGYSHYWSRSRDVLWKKGESSGHLQKIVEVLVDCDNDTLLYKVHQSGPACHTGAPNCFFRELKNETTVKLK